MFGVATLAATLLHLGCGTALGQDAGQPFGYVVPATKGAGKAQPKPYVPKEGDMIFYDDYSLIWTALFYWAGTAPPLHAGIVVKKVDGTMAALEAGPNDTIWVRIIDLNTRFPKFLEEYQGTITIRRCKKDLSPEESQALTKFAEAQDGKRYAVIRLLLQGTRFRSRGPLREYFLARTYLDRSSWFCSELVVAAGTVVGLFPNSVKANVTYPLDLVNNRRHDLSRVWHEAEKWQPNPKLVEER
jgi:hypothetical protein